MLRQKHIWRDVDDLFNERKTLFKQDKLYYSLSYLSKILELSVFEHAHSTPGQELNVYIQFSNRLNVFLLHNATKISAQSSAQCFLTQTSLFCTLSSFTDLYTSLIFTFYLFPLLFIKKKKKKKETFIPPI